MHAYAQKVKEAGPRKEMWKCKVVFTMEEVVKVMKGEGVGHQRCLWCAHVLAGSSKPSPNHGRDQDQHQDPN